MSVLCLQMHWLRGTRVSTDTMLTSWLLNYVTTNSSVVFTLYAHDYSSLYCHSLHINWIVDMIFPAHHFHMNMHGEQNFPGMFCAQYTHYVTADALGLCVARSSVAMALAASGILQDGYQISMFNLFWGIIQCIHVYTVNHVLGVDNYFHWASGNLIWGYWSTFWYELGGIENFVVL